MKWGHFHQSFFCYHALYSHMSSYVPYVIRARSKVLDFLRVWYLAMLLDKATYADFILTGNDDVLAVNIFPWGLPPLITSLSSSFPKYLTFCYIRIIPSTAGLLFEFWRPRAHQSQHFIQTNPWYTTYSLDMPFPGTIKKENTNWNFTYEWWTARCW